VASCGALIRGKSRRGEEVTALEFNGRDCSARKKRGLGESNLRIKPSHPGQLESKKPEMGAGKDKRREAAKEAQRGFFRVLSPIPVPYRPDLSSRGKTLLKLRNRKKGGEGDHVVLLGMGRTRAEVL